MRPGARTCSPGEGKTWRNRDQPAAGAGRGFSRWTAAPTQHGVATLERAPGAPACPAPSATFGRGWGREEEEEGAGVSHTRWPAGRQGQGSASPQGPPGGSAGRLQRSQRTHPALQVVQGRAAGDPGAPLCDCRGWQWRSRLSTCGAGRRRGRSDAPAGAGQPRISAGRPRLCAPRTAAAGLSAPRSRGRSAPPRPRRFLLPGNLAGIKNMKQKHRNNFLTFSFLSPGGPEVTSSSRARLAPSRRCPYSQGQGLGVSSARVSGHPHDRGPGQRTPRSRVPQVAAGTSRRGPGGCARLLAPGRRVPARSPTQRRARSSLSHVKRQGRRRRGCITPQPAGRRPGRAEGGQAGTAPGALPRSASRARAPGGRGCAPAGRGPERGSRAARGARLTPSRVRCARRARRRPRLPPRLAARQLPMG